MIEALGLLLDADWDHVDVGVSEREGVAVGFVDVIEALGLLLDADWDHVDVGVSEREGVED